MIKNDNETIVLTLSFLLTAGIAGGTLWMFRDSFGRLTGQDSPPQAPAKDQATNSQTRQDSPPQAPAKDQTPNPPARQDSPPQGTTAPKGTFNYGGSTTWAPIRGLVDPEISKDHPEFRLRYVDPIGRTPGSSSGIEMLIDQQLSFSQSSRSLREEDQEKAQRAGFRLLQQDVAIDGLAIVVNHDLNLAGITIGQLRDIYSGKIRNWKEVGGPDLPIIPYSRRLKDGGTVEFFWDHILDKQNFGNNVQFVYSTTPALRAVSENPGGIYYATASEVVPQCSVKPLPIGRTKANFVSPYSLPYVPPARCPQERNTANFAAFRSGEYPITRKLFVITRDEATIHRKAGDFYIAWLLSPEGQELIAQSGYIPIR